MGTSTREAVSLKSASSTGIRVSTSLLWRAWARHRWPVTVILLLAVIRVLYAGSLEVNSDEPQHLHVAWAWTQGLLPYRDVFDNHSPLFALLYSPLLRAFGERADIVPLMRLASLPWYALVLWATYRLGCATFDRWTGLAGAAIAATESTFFLKSVEFRPDTMWAAAWTVALVVAMEGTPNWRRWFCAGLFAGLALAISIKTSVLLTAGLFASVVVSGLLAYIDRAADIRRWLHAAGAWAGGFAIIPAAMVLVFFSLGAWPAMRYCLIEHNIVRGLGRWSDSVAMLRWSIPPLVVLPLVHVAYTLLLRSKEKTQAARRAWLLLACSGYLVLRDAFQPLIAGQDLLPWVPMASPFAAAGIRWLVAATAPPAYGGMLRNAAVAFTASAGLVISGAHHLPWQGAAEEYSRKLGEILHLAKPGSAVLDPKGDSIFRPRATYWDFENVSLYRFSVGLIPDDVGARLATCRIAVVVGDHWPEKLAAFIRSSYVPAGGDLFVPGKKLGQVRAGVPLDFEVDIPQTYYLRSDGTAFSGSIDGMPYVDALPLTAGSHSLLSARSGLVQIGWAGTPSSACPSSFPRRD